MDANSRIPSGDCAHLVSSAAKRFTCLSADADGTVWGHRRGCVQKRVIYNQLTLSPQIIIVSATQKGRNTEQSIEVILSFLWFRLPTM